MAIWLEIHCDVRRDGRDAIDPLKPLCWSNGYDHPSALCDNDRVSMIRAMKSMEIDARKAGWTKTKFGWCCPGCLSPVVNL